MALIAYASFAEVVQHERCDADFFANPYMDFLSDIFERCKEWIPLRDTASKLTSGHTPLRHNVNTGDIPFITVECIEPLQLRMDKAKRIWRHQLDGELRRVHIVPGDILISIKRRIVNAAVVTDDVGPAAVNQDVAVLKPNGGFLPEYIAAVLVSRVGKLQAYRRQTEQMNPYLSVGSLGHLMIPNLPEETQHSIAAITKRIDICLAEAAVHYAEAETLLESALGFDRLDLTPRLFYERPFSDVCVSGRVDAEYFQPRMRNLIGALSRDGKIISDVAKLSKRHFKPSPGVDFEYIEIGNVGNGGMTDTSTVAGEDAASRATWIVRPGDVITSTVRPIRRLSAIVSQEQSGAVASSGFAVLTSIDTEAVPPELLLAYLRHPLVCELLDLHTTASMYPAISTADLMQIPITLPEPKERAAVVDRVRYSFQAHRDASAMLEEAKLMVEEAVLGGQV